MQRIALLAISALLGSTVIASAITPAPQHAPAGIQLVQDSMKKDEKMSKDDKMKNEKMSKDKMKNDKMMKNDQMNKMNQ